MTNRTVHVTTTVDVTADGTALHLSTEELEHAVTDLVADGVAGELSVSVERTDSTRRTSPNVEGTSDSSLDVEAMSDSSLDVEINEPSQATFELYEDREQRWRWRLVHDNGNIIADSGGSYASRNGARTGIQSVRRNSPLAVVESG